MSEEIRFMSAADFAAKVDWEGGIADALHYGLKYIELNPNDERSRPLRDAWQEAERVYRESFEPAIRKVSDALEAIEEAEPALGRPDEESGD